MKRGAERARRFRSRRRAGFRVARVEIDEVAVTEMLIAARWLLPGDAENPSAVDAAIAAFLASAIAVDIRNA